MNPLETRALYDLSHTLAAPLLEKVRYPWEGPVRYRRLYRRPRSHPFPGGVRVSPPRRLDP